MSKYFWFLSECCLPVSFPQSEDQAEMPLPSSFQLKPNAEADSPSLVVRPGLTMLCPGPTDRLYCIPLKHVLTESVGAERSHNSMHTFKRFPSLFPFDLKEMLLMGHALTEEKARAKLFKDCMSSNMHRAWRFSWYVSQKCYYRRLPVCLCTAVCCHCNYNCTGCTGNVKAFLKVRKMCTWS